MQPESQPKAGATPEPELIVLFDGLCNLCCAAVDFIMAHDRRERFRFCPLQSEAATRLLRNSVENQQGREAIVLIENGLIYVRSAAWFRIARYLDGWWRSLYIFAGVPRPIRDSIYKLIARNRYDWFGKRDRLPNTARHHRFME